MPNQFTDYCEHCGRPFVYQRVTEQNKRILDLLVSGMRNKEIGDSLTPPIEERTVKAHVARLMRIFGVKNRVQLAFKYAQPMIRIALGIEESVPQIEKGAE